ncbi:MAG: DUF296 domain-containing protein [Terrestrivirus sp.]|uniref:DUF296 domain-containing protein n=1 Tax=Terrestrivirus sp. TaxID=2487775 RepID=A0A3G4ZMM0_9VIRU|nr:MAG: DUF296 domain-containing protein [Terrestrivirus sp.]
MADSIDNKNKIVKYTNKLGNTSDSNKMQIYQKKILFYGGAVITKNDSEYVSSAIAYEGKAPGLQVQLLDSNNSTKTYVVIFSVGDEIFSGLTEFANKYNITGAHFTAIGAMSKGTLGWYSPEKKAYKKIHIDGQAEICSLIGNIALYNGKPVVHAHTVVAPNDGITKGGHLIEGYVWPTLEVFVTVESNPILKSFDDKTGLVLINPNPNKT